MANEKKVAFKLESARDWLQWSYIMKLHFSSTTKRKAIFTGEETFEDSITASRKEAFLKLENSMKLDLMRNLGSSYASKG